MATKRKIPTKFRIPQPSVDQSAVPDKQVLISRIMTSYIRKKQKTGTKQWDSQFFMDKYALQIERYEQELIRRGYSLSPQQILKLNRIDVSSLAPEEESISLWPVKQEYIDAMEPDDEKTYFYKFIPCFSYGALRITKRRYLLFRIQDLDPETLRCRMDIQDYYCDPDTSPIGKVDAGRHVRVLIFCEKNPISGLPDLQIQPETASTYVDKYTALTPKQLHWNADEVDLWEHVTLQNAVDQEAAFQNVKEDPTYTISIMFCKYTALSNWYLQNYRPVVEREPKKQTTAHSSAKHTSPADPEAPKIRKVGNIRFISVKSPKKITEKTIRTYRLVSWNVRGHVRHYKSGKTAYIKSHTSRRKGLHKSDTTPQTILSVFQYSEKGDTSHGT